jgi:hypothetical protein
VHLFAIVVTHALRVQPARNLLPLRPAGVVIVLEIMGQFMDLDGAKPCLLEILHGPLLAPHGAEAIASLRQ